MKRNIFKTRKVLCLALAFVTVLSLSISATEGGLFGGVYDRDDDTYNVVGDTYGIVGDTDDIGDASDDDDAQDATPTVSVWEWVDEEGIVDVGSSVTLSDVSADAPMNFDALVSLLPQSIRATVGGEVQTLALTWSCGSFGESATGGIHTFTAALPQGYALGEDADALRLTVRLGDPSTWIVFDETEHGLEYDGSWYHIYDIDDLNEFAAGINDGSISDSAWVRIENDIEGTLTTPIGTPEYPFRGTFEGAEHTLSLEYYFDDEYEYTGLFGYVKGAEILSINIVVLYYERDVSAMVAESFLCGYANDSYIANCHISVDPDLSYIFTGYYGYGNVSGGTVFGGAVGVLENTDRNFPINTPARVEYCSVDFGNATIRSYAGVWGGLIGRLCVSDAYYGAEVYDGVFIDGCTVNAMCGGNQYIRSYNNDSDTYAGGLIGVLDSTYNYPAVVSIDNCGFAGYSFYQYWTCVGGLIGYVPEQELDLDDYLYFANCYSFVDRFNISGDDYGLVIGLWDNHTTLIYSLAGNGNLLNMHVGSYSAYSYNADPDGYLDSDCEFYATDSFISGEVCYKLNENYEDSGAPYSPPRYEFHQTLEEDEFPVLDVYDEHGTVYLACGGSGYTNDPDGHSYSNGFCTNCGAYQAATVSGNTISISNAGQLFWALAHIGGAATTSNCGVVDASVTASDTFKLTANITINSNLSTSTAGARALPHFESSVFTGTFDGQGYTITGLYISASNESSVGLFPKISGGTVRNLKMSECVVSISIASRYVGLVTGELLNYGRIENVVLDEKCSVSGLVNSGGPSYVGGIAGRNGIAASDTAVDTYGGTITKCINAGYVGGRQYVGGISGENAVGKTLYCYTTGTVAGYSLFGGITGAIISIDYNEMKGCYSTATIDTSQLVGNGRCGGICAYLRFVSVSYCYTTHEPAVGELIGYPTEVATKTEAQFASGEVAYLLNEGVTDGTQMYYQLIGTDAEPHFNAASGNTVYYNGDRCDGTGIYSNTEGTLYDGSHDYTDNNGFCIFCDAYEPAVLSGDTYQIGNGGQLYWFASLVNGTLADTCGDTTTAQNTAANGKLIRNITINADVNNASGRRSWTPIGFGGVSFTGTFDGGSYSISGLYCNTTQNGAGLFCYTSGATISHVTVKDSHFNTSATYAGAVIATGDNSTVTYCTSRDNYICSTGGDKICGGIVGNMTGTITHCTNTSTVVGDRCGGILGYSSDYSAYGMFVEDCVNEGSVTSRYAGGIVGIAPNRYNSSDNRIARCYNVGTITSDYAYASGIITMGNNLLIEDCYNAGTVTNTDGEASAVVTGHFWGTQAKSTITIRNCHNYGSVSGEATFFATPTELAPDSSRYDNYTIIENCYSLSTAGIAAVEGVELKTADEFASGEVTYLLNEGVTDGSQVWWQDVDNEQMPWDAYPVFAGAGATVYRGYLENCFTYTGNNIDASGKDALRDPVYSNDSEIPSYPHSYVNGFCVNEQDGVVCGKYQRATLVTEDNYEQLHLDESYIGYYAVGNAGQLYWMVAHLEGRAQNSDCDDYGNSTYYGYNTIDVLDMDRRVTDTSGIVLTSSIAVNNDDNPDSAQMWEPIGSHQAWITYDVNAQDRENKFYSGVFDGRGHTISNLKVDTDEYGGLFAIFNGTARSFVLRGAEITSSATGTYHVGGVAAIANDDSSTSVLIEDVGLVSCDISSSSTSVCVGGIIGYASSAVTVRRCYNEGTSVSGGGYTGGIIGRALPTTAYEALIEHCYNTGTIDGSGATAAGGIIGRAENSTVVIRSCHSVGTASGAASVGGIVGSKYNSAPISYAYSTQSPLFASSGQADSGIDTSTTGVKSAAQFKSGEVAYLLNAGVTNGSQVWYQDIDNGNEPYDNYPVFSGGTVYASGNCMGMGADLSIPPSNYPFPVTGDMHTFDDDGFCKNADTQGNVCGKYESAVLVTEDNYASLGLDADFVDYYAIGNAGQLYWMSEHVIGKTYLSEKLGGSKSAAWNEDVNNETDFVLTADITINEGLSQSTDGARQWVYDDTLEPGFSGVFDGNGHSITGLYINVDSSDSSDSSDSQKTQCHGLFGAINDGTVKNLTMKESIVNVSCEGTVGLIAGFAAIVSDVCEDITIEGTCSVTGKDATGGVFGRTQYVKELRNVSSSATVSGGNCVGGIIGNTAKTMPIAGVGSGSKSLIIGCTNDGNVSGSDKVGGIVGYDESSLLDKVETSIIDCVNNGTVSGTSEGAYIGGIAGIGEVVIGCTNNATVSGGSSVGGIVGESYGVIERCTNSGTISGSDSVGGIAGMNSGSTIENCRNTGDIISTVDYAGGIVGVNYSIVESCYNIGSITGSSVGEITGYDFGTITNCYYQAAEGADGAAETELPKTAAQFASGEVAWLLNKGVTDGTQAWYQNIDNGETPDAYPLFEGGTVYRGYKHCQATEMIYSNSELFAEQGMHKFGTKGFCTNEITDNVYCDKYQSAVLVEEANCAELGLTADYDGYYAIKNAGQLYWMSEHIIGAAETGKSAKYDASVDATDSFVLIGDVVINEGLTADPVGEPRQWVYSSDLSLAFKGIFDGNGHSITGLYINTDSSNVRHGLFGCLSGATVRDLTMRECIVNAPNADHVSFIVGLSVVIDTLENISIDETCSLTGGDRVGGIIGEGWYNVVKNCRNAASVTGNSYVGGITGYANGAENCYNTGTISGNSHVGGILGAAFIGFDGYCVKNCYNTGNVTGSGNAVGKIAGHFDDTGTFTNCYYLAGSGAAGAATTELPKTANQFASGEVAWLLNEQQPVGTNIEGLNLVWYQDVDNADTGATLDASPNFTDAVVYPIGNCMGGNVVGYTNQVELAASGTHSFDDDGFCENTDAQGNVCGKYQSATEVTEDNCRILFELNPDYVGYYAIENAGQLYWMSEHVAGYTYMTEKRGGTMSAAWNADVDNNDSFVLVNDIIINEGLSQSTDGARQWVYNDTLNRPLGGVFDGNDHSITGLYINVDSSDSQESQCHGLFGAIGDGTVKNLTMKESIVNVSLEDYVGLIAGFAVIVNDVCENITIEGTCSVTGKGTTGGVFGHAQYVKELRNVSSSATVSGGNCVGGIIGDATKSLNIIAGVGSGSKSLIINCTNDGTVSGNGSVGGIVGYDEPSLMDDIETNIIGCTNDGTVSGSYSVGGIVGGGGEVVTGCTNSGTVSGSDYVGGIVGESYGGTIENCRNTGDIISTVDYAGGIVGLNSNTVESCYNIGSITGSSVGEITGYDFGTITNCYYQAAEGADGAAETELPKTAAQFASGEVAWLLNKGVTDGTQAWYQDIDIDETPDAYPLFEGGTVYYGYEHCQSTVLIYSNRVLSTEFGAHNFVNGFCANKFTDGVYCDMYESATLVEDSTLGSLDESYLGYYAIKNAGQLYWMSEHIIGVAETSDNCAEYDASVDRTDKFVLTGDVTINAELLGDPVKEPREWVYSGDTSLAFRGIFDGNGHSITGLYINASADGEGHGLFGAIEDGTVKDLTMRGCVLNAPDAQNAGMIAGFTNGAAIEGIVLDEDCSVSGGNLVGGIVGYALYESAITSCVNSGEVSGSDNVGGIVGYTFSDVTITQCVNNGSVESSSYAGGIIALLNDCDIARCANSGAISATARAGGIAASASSGSITHCYNTGSVESGDYTGGIAGQSSTGISHCYSIGTITGAENRYGGICGSGGTLTNCYYLGETGEVGAAAATELPKTIEQFASGEVAWLLNDGKPVDTEEAALVWYQDVDNDETPYDASPLFEGGIVYPIYDCTGTVAADFTNLPALTETIAHNFVNGFCDNEDSEGNKCDKYESATLVEETTLGTLDPKFLGYYAIENAGQLYWMSEHIIGAAATGKSAEYDASVDRTDSFVLTGDIVINVGLSQSTDGARQWVYSGDSAVSFRGTFDGNEKSITGLYINTDLTVLNHGLFGYVNAGTVKNLTMKESVVNVPNGSYVGTVIGLMGSESVVENVKVDERCSVNGSTLTGGVVGRSDLSTISHSSNAGSVSGAERVGGIVGVNYHCTSASVEYCSNTGTVTGTFYVGGISGINYYCASAPVEYCSNTGTVTGTNYVGGISGSSNGSSITKCYNAGSISAGNGYAGGISGLSAQGDASVTDCYNVGSVSSRLFAGGIVGALGSDANPSNCVVKNCYSIGTVSGDGALGGVVSNVYADGSVVNCYSLTAPISTNNGTATDVEQKTANQFASGEVAWLLNSGVTDGTQVWYQNIDNGETPDASPLFEGGTVYPIYNCVDAIADYTNIENAPYGVHSFDTHGFCENVDGESVRCCVYEPAELGMGMYVECEIENLGQLFWFAAHVNNADPTDDALIDALTVNDSVTNRSRAKLLNSLDFDNVPNGIEWLPIGAYANYNDALEDRPYLGTFDGGRHTVSNLTVSIDREAGFFGRVGNAETEAVVKNLGVIDAAVHSTNDRAGVLAGELHKATVTNCFAVGTATSGDAERQTGAFAGEAADATLDSCHAYDETGKLAFLDADGTSPASMTNCYYLADTGESGTAATLLAKDADQFASGEVCFFLNGSRPESEGDGTDLATVIWRQTVGEMAYPTFSGDIVYSDHNADIVQVEVSWTSMDFRFGQNWDPETHTYVKGSWASNGGGGKLTISNLGKDVKVNVTYEMISGSEGVLLSMYEDWLENGGDLIYPDGEGNLALRSGSSIENDIMLSGELDSPLTVGERRELASITVAIVPEGIDDP